jgi:hypothetical protein
MVSLSWPLLCIGSSSDMTGSKRIELILPDAWDVSELEGCSKGGQDGSSGSTEECP